jgi:hypothetical protein
MSIKLSQLIAQRVLLIFKLCPTSFPPSLSTCHEVNIAKSILQGHVNSRIDAR